jgi:hypothetical protein
MAPKIETIIGSVARRVLLVDGHHRIVELDEDVVVLCKVARMAQALQVAVGVVPRLAASLVAQVMHVQLLVFLAASFAPPLREFEDFEATALPPWMLQEGYVSRAESH